MFKTWFYSFVFLFCLGLQAQEGLRPLWGNNALPDEELSPAQLEQRRSAVIDLQLPFKDDFSYALKQVYPLSTRWSDDMVFINAGFGINPQSFGVATFDGLNNHGYPYVPGLPNLNNSEPADTLTSQPIDLHVIAATSKTLQPSDSLALTFYYQARGFGEVPESGDSLILDFYRPLENRWVSRVWFSRGNLNGNVKDTVFKYAMVRIDSAAYFHPGFRFRFRNRATTAGNYDHWNLDYVYLDQNIYTAKPIFDDLTFGYTPTSFLQEYSAMPFQQYQIADVAEKLSVKIRNNGPNISTMSYLYDVYNDASKTMLYRYDGGPVNLPPYSTSGYSKLSQHATPPVKANFTFPLMTDSTDYLIKHYVLRSGTGADFNYENDTVYQYQRFRNYFAYDDGTAEAGYYVKGVGGRIAVKLKLTVPDSLRAVRIYFDPAGKVLSASSFSFNIKVWADGGNGPGSEIRSEPAYAVKYIKDGFKGVPEYSLQTRLYLTPGTYYVGFQQKIEAGITVGYDLNYNFSRNMYFDSGTGWEQSTLGGAIMLRPVFGQYVPPPPPGFVENAIGRFRIYPNPSSDVFSMESNNDATFTWKLYNSLGQLVLQNEEAQSSYTVPTNDLSTGVYILHISSGKTLSRQKVLVQH